MPAAGGWCGGAKGCAGAADPPIPIGATPTIVPFSLLGIAAAPGGGNAPGAGRPGGAVGGGGMPGAAPGWFIMSIVPLNFGAAALFKWKLHLEHV
jgi:hypothetical protein